MSDALKAREALARLRENLASFDAEVAYELATGGERADLWGEIDVNVEDLRAALSALDQPSGVRVKPLNDDQIMEVIRECAPWETEPQLNNLLTYEKSPPMFPQATYDVPSYRATKLVRAIEARILSAIGAEGWRTMDSAPKDGTKFLATGPGYEWPEVLKWEAYDADVAQEVGEPGYFTFAEALLADVADSPDDLTHWRPLPSPPEPRP